MIMGISLLIHQIDENHLEVGKDDFDVEGTIL
jgi:hypothetical protein